jgi:hypothetical protein
MYQVKTTSQTFNSFLTAVAAGKAACSEVFEVETGVRRWAPAAPIAAKAARQYRERLAARAAHEAMVK